MNEIWSDIKEYPNYMVSNLGSVKSLSNNKTRKEKILKQCKNNKGYLLVGLCKNANEKKYQVHRLVAQTFIPNPDNKSCIDHINGDKSDNRVCNLKWVTHEENSDNPISKNKHIKFFKENCLKPIIQFSKDNQFIRKWDSALDVQRELGIHNSYICKCCKGKQKSAGNYIWKYAN